MSVVEKPFDAAEFEAGVNRVRAQAREKLKEHVRIDQTFFSRLDLRLDCAIFAFNESRFDHAREHFEAGAVLLLVAAHVVVAAPVQVLPVSETDVN